LKHPGELEDSTRYTADEMRQHALAGDASLQEALKYEGDTMGHCVGGHCDDVLSGYSQIYSLRNKKTGEPHVTIEVELPDPYPWLSGDRLVKEFGDRGRNAWVGFNEAYNAGQARDLPTFLQEKAPEMWQQLTSRPPRIVQIKGKQNRAPKEEYLPFVQDFVRSGQWSDVGDLQNAGLTRRASLDAAEQAKAPAGQEWFTDSEIEALYDDVRRDIAAGKFADGGLVDKLPETVSVGYNAPTSWDDFFSGA
jgi:hypothetical protein